jgi:hypothetical protein
MAPVPAYLRLVVAALVGGTVSGLSFARAGLRPWEAVPIGLFAAAVFALVSRPRR